MFLKIIGKSPSKNIFTLLYLEFQTSAHAHIVITCYMRQLKTYIGNSFSIQWIKLVNEIINLIR